MYSQVLNRCFCKYKDTVSASLYKFCVAKYTKSLLHRTQRTLLISKCNPNVQPIRMLTVSTCKRAQKKDQMALVIRSEIFDAIENKNKETFLGALELFEAKSGKDRRGHVEFIYAAMKYLEEFGVNKDLETYKKLMDVFPKGKFIPTTMFQFEFMHYPKQQNCAIDLLEEMETNGVMPDREMKDILTNIFGKWNYPVRKYMRMMYWMPKFKNLSPWPLPAIVPKDAFLLAKLAIERMCTVDLQYKVTVFETKELKDSLDETWIVSAQSPIQQVLLGEATEKTPIYVEGPFQIYIREHMVNYFMLRMDGKPPPPKRTKAVLDDVSNISLWMFGEEEKPKELSIIPSVHEQEDNTILALCATGSSSHDSVLSWVRFLQQDNPQLSKVPVIFSLRILPTTTDIIPSGGQLDESKQKLTSIADDKKQS